MRARLSTSRSRCAAVVLAAAVLAAAALLVGRSGVPVLAGGAAEAAPTPGALERVSVSGTGAEADNASGAPALSADGRFVAFTSRATNLVPGDTNRRQDVFVHDRQTGETTRVSVSTAGDGGNGASGAPALSADGRFVAFESRATNLVSGDVNRRQDVFVRDRQMGETTRVSVADTGAQGNNDSGTPALSADGRFVAFVSRATNLVPGDVSKRQDVFVHDRQMGTTARVSVAGTGALGNGDSGAPALSADGRFVAFESRATNLVPGDVNRRQDVFVHDHQMGTTARVSVAGTGAPGNGDSGAPALSADGRFVAFASRATNLVPGDLNRRQDVFVHDRESGHTERVSVSSAGGEANGDSAAPSLDGSGRFVVFQSRATVLVTGDANRRQDVFLHDLDTGQTTRVSDAAGVPEENQDGGRAVISEDGNVVAFVSLATNLVAGDVNRRADVFAVPRNRHPVAVDDAATTAAGVPVEIAILANDSDPDGDDIAVAHVADGAHGSVSVVDGVATYTPAGAFVGQDAFTYSIVDGQGGTASATVTVQMNATAPINQAPVVTAGVETSAITLPDVARLTGSASDDGLPGPLTLTWSRSSGPGVVTFADASAVSTTASFSEAGTYELRLSAFDGARTSTADVTVTVSPEAGGGGAGLPPDPRTVAPPLDAGLATVLGRGVEFLYTGANPIQTGVAPYAIDPVRAAVVRGRVVDRQGSALPAVQVTILGHPALGQTLSRADGTYDLVVNGGGPLTVHFEKTGRLPAQRRVHVPWQDFALVPDVALIPLDAQVTAVALGAGAWQVARGTASTDLDGGRTATLLFAPGTTATMVMPDGSMQPLATLNVRATEYTVGATGPTAMPAPLPGGTAYTYAVNLSADEALAAGAREVRFDPAAALYVENFLNFAVGTIVPQGTYDFATGTWVASPNGRVVAVLGVTAGLADLDTTGSGVADQGVGLGVTAGERERLAALYPGGGTFWRVPIPHFSPQDINWCSRNLPGPANPPPLTTPGPRDCHETRRGSILGVQSQTCGEAVGVVGTPFHLRYSTDRVPGRTAAYTARIPVTGPSLPDVGVTIDRVEVKVEVAGRSFVQTFPPVPDQAMLFTWDGLDVYGRTVLGEAPVTVTTTFVYTRTIYKVASTFGVAGAGDTAVLTREEQPHSQVHQLLLGVFDARAQALGGWTLSPHHAYDPIARVLYQGDGARRRADTLNHLISRVAGRPDLPEPQGVAVGPDGTIYVADSSRHRVAAIRRDGSITTVAGTEQCLLGVDLDPDGIAATSANLCSPIAVRAAADGSLYVLEVGQGELAGGTPTLVRRISPDGLIHRAAGNGTSGDAGDGGPAVQASLGAPSDIAVGPDGTLYVADTDSNRIRRVGTDGIITTVAGTGASDFGGDGGPAGAAALASPRGVAVGRAGEIYVADRFNVRIRRMTTDGIISTIAGDGSFCPETDPCGDGGPAVQASLADPGRLAVGADGSLYIADGRRIRRVGTDGIIRTVAGTGEECLVPFGLCADGGAALRAPIGSQADVALGPDGALYLGDWRNFRVRRVGPAMPGFTDGEFAIPSGDGGALYHFDARGRHLRTVHALTGADLHTFGYDGAGRLVLVTDGDGSTTAVQRDGAGNPTAIVAPFGQVTTLAVGAGRYLASIVSPASEAHQFGYTAGGLLTSRTGPRGFATTFTYDARGRLEREDDPAGGFRTLERTEPAATDFSVLERTALGVTLRHDVLSTAAGDRELVTTLPGGLQARIVERADGATVATSETGLLTTRTPGPDPRFGLQAPVDAAVVTRTPAGLTSTTTRARTVTLTSADDPLSLTGITDTATLDGATYVSSYTAATRTFTLTTPGGRPVTTTVDALGRTTRRQVGDLASWEYTYDAHGRLTTAVHGTGPDARTLTFAHDAAGYVSAVTDPLSRVTRFAYDAAGRTTRKTYPDGRVLLLEHDAHDNVTAIIPPGRPAHGFEYSPVDANTRYTPPAVGPGPRATAYTYNADRQLTAIALPDGRALGFGYDAAGRLATLTVPEGDHTYAYSPTTGNLTGVTAPGGGTLAHTHDGPFVTGVTWTGAVAGSLAHALDGRFRLVAETVNGGAPVAFQYDADGLLTAAGDLTLARSPATGLVTSTALGRVSTASTYNPFGEVVRHTAALDGANFLTVEPAYDGLGRVTEKTETEAGATTVTAYTYDAAGRLAAVTRTGAPAVTYAYDDNGNRLTRTVGGIATAGTYDDQDRLVQYGAVSYTYTASGDLASKAVGGQTTLYDYDVAGNLRAAILPGGTRIDYVIDGAGRRIGKKVDGALVQGFLYAGLRPVAELDVDGQLVSHFVHASRGNTPDYMVRGGALYRIVADALGSPRVVVHVGTGAVVQRVEYDEFGNVLEDTNPGFQPFGFAGGLRDQHTGLTRFGARDYDAETGRWTTPDPIQFAGGSTNLYAYVRQDPVNFIDPTGLRLTEKECQTLQAVLDWEETHGTRDTAWKFSNTFPFFHKQSTPLGKDFDNKSVPTAYGDVDLDWYMTVIQLDFGIGIGDLGHHDVTYLAAKAAWNTERSARSLLGGKPRTYPLPYAEANEALGQHLLRTGRDRFKDLFPRDWLNEQCDCYTRSAGGAR